MTFQKNFPPRSLPGSSLRKKNKFNKDNPCVENFQFIAMDWMEGLHQGIQGILGLGPVKPDSHSLIQQMLESKLINKGIASFSLGNKAPGMD